MHSGAPRVVPSDSVSADRRQSAAAHAGRMLFRLRARHPPNRARRRRPGIGGISGSSLACSQARTRDFELDAYQVLSLSAAEAATNVDAFGCRALSAYSSRRSAIGGKTYQLLSHIRLGTWQRL